MNRKLDFTMQLLVLSVVLMVISSCQDSLYDIDKGINTEMNLGGDSLAIPIGSTDTLRLSDFLDPEDINFLEIMEDGGYGLRIEDSIYVEDLLKDLDKSKLKFDDYLFSEVTSISFSDIDLDNVKIPGFTKEQYLGMNIPKVTIEDITPAVNMNKQFVVGFADYALDPTSLDMDDIDRNTKKENFIANQIPYDGATNPSFTFNTTEPILINDAQGNPLKVAINYSIEVPEGINNIYQIDLNSGASLEISIELPGATTYLSSGNFTPSLEIDPSNLFKFSPLTPLTNGKIVFGESDALTNFNNYTSNKKVYSLTAFHNLPVAVNNTINVAKDISVSGSFAASGTVRENQALNAKDIDLVVNAVIKNVSIKNMDFDIPTFSTSISGSSTLEINETGLPEQVQRINTIHLGKTDGSTLPTNMVIQFMPSNLPIMKSSNYKINSLDITFPDGFAFSNMAGKTYSTNNVDFNPTSGFKVELNLSQIDLSSIPINNGILNWQGIISYSGQMSVNGRMNSEEIKPASNPVINLTTQTALKLNSATVVTNIIKEQIVANDINIELDIDVDEEVKRLTTVTMKPGGILRVNINRPTLPLTLKADALAIQFSNLFEFTPQNGLVDNKYTINGTIPDFIELELKALHINKELVNGKLTLNEQISVSGGIELESGIVNSSEIADLSASTIHLQTIVSDLYIASTTLELDKIEASYNDSTEMKLEINDIPDEITSLDSILLKSGSTIALDINLSNLPDIGDSPLNATIIVKFPKLLSFASGQVNANNELIINQAIVDNKIARTLQLRGFEFDGTALNGKLNINEKVDYDVTVTVNDLSVNSEELTGEPVEVGVKVSLKGLEFQRVYGKFNVNLDEQLDIDNISLDLPDMLKGEGIVLDVSNPVLTMSSVSNIGIPVDAELGFTKFIGGQLQTADKVKFNFSLPKANSPSESVTAYFWVAPSETGKPDNYTYVPTELQKLLNPIPDSIKIDINPNINSNQQHFIDLMANYNLKLKYDINIPFKFGQDLNITIKDTLENVDLGLEDIELNSGSLELFGTITNSIPLNLELQLIIVDENFTILATTTKQSIQAGSPDGKGVVSKLSIKIADSLDALKRMNKVILTFKATSDATVAGTPIKPENYIKAELKARVTGGVTVTL